MNYMHNGPWLTISLPSTCSRTAKQPLSLGLSYPSSAACFPLCTSQSGLYTATRVVLLSPISQLKALTQVWGGGNMVYNKTVMIFPELSPDFTSLHSPSTWPWPLPFLLISSTLACAKHSPFPSVLCLIVTMSEWPSQLMLNEITFPHHCFYSS